MSFLFFIVVYLVVEGNQNSNNLSKIILCAMSIYIVKSLKLPTDRNKIEKILFLAFFSQIKVLKFFYYFELYLIWRPFLNIFVFFHWRCLYFFTKQLAIQHHFFYFVARFFFIQYKVISMFFSKNCQMLQSQMNETKLVVAVDIC